jgi:hypothetical protein
MNQKDIKLYIEKLNDSGKFVFSSNRYVFFSPALVLISLGFAVILVPKLFLYFIAAFFLTAGCIACFLVWKFLQFKQKFEKITQEFKGQVIVQGVRVEKSAAKNSELQNIRSKQTNLFEEPFSGDLNLTDVTSRESKKIIFH